METATPRRRDAATPKDTARNIRTMGEFVVHLVEESMGAAMNICATDFPADWSEIEAAGLELEPSQTVKVPRIKGAVAALECGEAMTLEIGRNRVILGEIRAIGVRDGLVDAQKFYVQTENLKLIGRMGGLGDYARLCAHQRHLSNSAREF